MDAETRKFLEEFRAEVESRFDGLDQRLDDAARERSLMWDALMRLAAPPGSFRTLKEAVEKRRNGA